MKQKKTDTMFQIDELLIEEKKNFFSPVNFTFQSLVILIVTFIFYANTLWNGTALDDGLVWVDNAFVKKGFNGIGDILFNDSFFGSLGHSYNLAGGRWRPLSLVTFAIEHQLWGETWWISHLINLLLYAFTGILLLKFLRSHILKEKTFAAFSVVFLFIIHPVHTEAIANIKSRDEILSLLFLILTLQFSLDVANGKRKKPTLLISSLFLFLALLSKENGLMFLFILPLTLYFFSNLSLKNIFIQSLPAFAAIAIYIFLRTSIVPFTNQKVTELMDNPYLLATTDQRYATIIYVLLYYLRLLFYPHPLTYDYSFNQIPYKNFSDLSVVSSLIIHVSLIVYALATFRKKNILAWCIFFYMASIFIVSNFVLNIGAPLAERFLYQPSIAFFLFFVLIIEKVFSGISVSEFSRKNIALTSLVLIAIPCGYKTITRNEVWRAGPILGITDVNASPNSARANTYAGANYISFYDTCKNEQQKKYFLQKTLDYCNKSLTIYPDFFQTYMYLGFAYSRSDSLDKAVAAWKRGQQLKPGDDYVNKNLKIISDKYFDIGLNAGGRKSYDTSIYFMKKALSISPNVVDYNYNLGGAYFMKNNLDSAEKYFNDALKLNPNHQQSRDGLSAVLSQKKNKNE